MARPVKVFSMATGLLVPPRQDAHKAWKTMRLNHLKLYPECRACGSFEYPCIHHLRYRGKRGLSEQPGDLVTLCRSCHDSFHSQYKEGSLVENTIMFIQKRQTTNATGVTSTHDSR